MILNYNKKFYLNKIVISSFQKYPGDNLLKSDISSCWKCKNVGEKQAVIILQLEKLSQIHSIHIGNENSAFIEILVSRSAAPDVYEVKSLFNCI